MRRFSLLLATLATGLVFGGCAAGGGGEPGGGTRAASARLTTVGDPGEFPEWDYYAQDGEHPSIVIRTRRSDGTPAQLTATPHDDGSLVVDAFVGSQTARVELASDGTLLGMWEDGPDVHRLLVESASDLETLTAALDWNGVDGVPTDEGSSEASHGSDEIGASESNASDGVGESSSYVIAPYWLIDTRCMWSSLKHTIFGSVEAPECRVTRTFTPEAGGRLIALVIGVSNYAHSNPLPGPAAGAVSLATTLRRGGVDVTLLTDASATVENIRSNMRTLGDRIQGNDVFLFVYNGHGTQSGGSMDRREIDGFDEGISTYDGVIYDDEMEIMFDRIHARVAILALDSCWAAGFDRDVISKPGRVGLFASEEDGYAWQGRAMNGGYLPFFLEQALGGRADSHPRDYRLTVGEVTRYLYVAFVAASDQQLPVFNRGLVSVDTVLWTY